MIGEHSPRVAAVTGATEGLGLSAAQSPAQAAIAPLDLSLGPIVDPRFHGELVRFGIVVPWR